MSWEYFCKLPSWTQSPSCGLLLESKLARWVWVPLGLPAHQHQCVPVKHSAHYGVSHEDCAWMWRGDFVTSPCRWCLGNSLLPVPGFPDSCSFLFQKCLAATPSTWGKKASWHIPAEQKLSLLFPKFPEILFETVRHVRVAVPPRAAVAAHKRHFVLPKPLL